MVEKIAKIIERLKDEYQKQDLCMYDFLAERSVPRNISIEQSMQIYAHLMNWAEDDEFYRTNKEEEWGENLVTDERTNSYIINEVEWTPLA